MRPDPLPRLAYRFAHAITTRWADNDVYGHVNNALYYNFFDTTILAYLLASTPLEPSGGEVQVFVAASDCAYFRAFAFPETIESALAVAIVGASSVTWRIGLFGAGEDEPRAQGSFVHVCVDRASGRPRRWPQEFRRAFEAVRLQATVVPDGRDADEPRSRRGKAASS